MKLLAVCFILLVGFSACVEKSNKLPVVEFDDISSFDVKHEIPLDSIASKTEIIRFTSDTGVIIGDIKLVSECKNYLFLISDDQVLQFTTKGEFVNKIGKPGKGPGEYISAWALDIDEINELVYVMDYFGRKMLLYRFDGSYEKSFDLPEMFSLTGFKLYQGKILYTSSTNSMSPEMLLYDQANDELLPVSSSDREMRAGEAFMGSDFLLGDMQHPYLFHYFNDTVFLIDNLELKPMYLLKFGNLKIKYEELVVDQEKTHGSRAQVFQMVRGDQFTFVQYGVSRFKGKRAQTYLTGIYRNDFSSFSPCVNMVSTDQPLFSIPSGRGFYAGYGNTLLTTLSASEVLKVNPGFDISQEDNPILLKYYLR